MPRGHHPGTCPAVAIPLHSPASSQRKFAQPCCWSRSVKRPDAASARSCTEIHTKPPFDDPYASGVRRLRSRRGPPTSGLPTSTSRSIGSKSSLTASHCVAARSLPSMSPWSRPSSQVAPAFTEETRPERPSMSLEDARSAPTRNSCADTDAAALSPSLSKQMAGGATRPSTSSASLPTHAPAACPALASVLRNMSALLWFSGASSRHKSLHSSSPFCCQLCCCGAGEAL